MFLETFTTFFLLDSRYLGQLSTNFRSILHGIGCTIAGDEKLLHITGLSPDVKVVYMKPDRVGLWIYELCVKLSNDLPYVLDLWLHDSVDTIGETTPVSDVVAHWGRSIHSFNVGRMPNTVLVFDSYYLDEAGRQELQAKNIKFIGAVNPQRFPLLTSLIRQGVYARGQWKGLWNEKKKELIVHVWRKDDKRYTTLSSAYARTASKGEYKRIPVASDNAKMFQACDSIINRLRVGYGHTSMVVEVF